MDERELIAKLRPLAGPAGLDLRDDAALLSVPSSKDLVISTDTMVEGVHFPEGRIGGGFSERLLRTALSDLAAKAARPIGYSLNLTWPTNREPRWIDGFVRGLMDAQQAFDCPLMGGDTTSGGTSLIASATVFGVVPKGRMVTRDGAKPGDRLWHTGTLGRAEHGLQIVMGRLPDMPPNELMLCESAYLRPEPRLVFRKVLRRYATACADISDGVVSEAGHLAAASNVRIDLDAQTAKRGRFGDDYELLFTAKAGQTEELVMVADALGVPITQCGAVSLGEGVWIDGGRVEPSGYRHTL